MLLGNRSSCFVQHAATTSAPRRIAARNVGLRFCERRRNDAVPFAHRKSAASLRCERGVWAARYRSKCLPSNGFRWWTNRKAWLMQRCCYLITPHAACRAPAPPRILRRSRRHPAAIRSHPFRGDQILVRLAPADDAVLASFDQHFRRAGPIVVIAAHGEAVGAGGEDG